MSALRKSGLEVMVDIPNDMLVVLATSMNTANPWVVYQCLNIHQRQSQYQNGFANLPVIVSKISWTIDGDTNANTQYAQRFNQGFMNHISTCQSTPMRLEPIDAYLFSLNDEDEKSIQLGNFERHWGLYTYDGWPKYLLNLGATKIETISYTSANENCTSLGYKTSCGDLDMQGNISYAFNSYYQKNDQDDVAWRTLQQSQTKIL